MRHHAALTMSAMLAITFVCSYLPELFVLARPAIARPTPHIAMLTTGGQEMSDKSLPRVDIIYAHANMPLDLIEASLAFGARGLVMAGAGDGDFPAVAVQTLAKAVRAGVVVVRSSRLERGTVLRNHGVDDDALGFVVSGGFNAAQSRVLLQLALLQTTDPTTVQKLFDDEERRR